MALLLLAGLQTIDGTLYEAAKVDGCGKVRSFFSITIPLLKPTMLVSVLFRTMDTFKAFDLPSVLLILEIAFKGELSSHASCKERLNPTLPPG